MRNYIHLSRYDMRLSKCFCDYFITKHKTASVFLRLISVTFKIPLFYRVFEIWNVDNPIN